jgi:hypothetical protein
MSRAVPTTWTPAAPLEGYGEVHQTHDPHPPALNAPGPTFPPAAPTRLVRCTALVQPGRNTRPPPLTRALRTIRFRSISP